MASLISSTLFLRLPTSELVLVGALTACLSTVAGEILGNWAFLKVFDSIFQAAYIVFEFRNSFIAWSSSDDGSFRWADLRRQTSYFKALDVVLKWWKINLRWSCGRYWNCVFNWGFIEFFDFDFKAAESFSKFVNTVLKTINVSFVLTAGSTEPFFNSNWNGIVVDWAFLELFGFVLEAEKSFFEFDHVDHKNYHVGVVDWSLYSSFFNSGWREVLNNWAFFKKFDFILNAANWMIKFRIVRCLSFELLDFMLKAAESFCEFVNTIFKASDVSFMVNSWFSWAFLLMRLEWHCHRFGVPRAAWLRAWSSRVIRWIHQQRFNWGCMD